MSESRRAPLTTRHKARFKQKTAAKVMALEEGLTRKTVRIAEFKIVGMAARVHDRERDTRVINTCKKNQRAKTCSI